MRRVVVFLLAALGVALVASGPRDVELPPVSAPPPPVASFARESTREPEVVRVQESLRWRHTGLSESELWGVAETIVREARRNSLDPDLVMAVVQVESGGYNFAVSNVGAMGLMQLMPTTGEELARSLDIDWRGSETLFDPVVNVTLGVAYLRQLSDRYGTWEAALAAYNWGPARIDRRLQRGVALPDAYARQVLELYAADDTRARS